MKTFQVITYEVLGVCEDIEAEDSQQALKIAEEKYLRGETTVGDRDYIGPVFAIKNDGNRPDGSEQCVGTGSDNYFSCCL